MYRITINGQLLHEIDTYSVYRLSSGRLDEEVNQIPSFTFRIPSSNPLYGTELNDRKDIIEVTNTRTKEVEFEGTLLTHSESMDANGRLAKNGVCEGYLGYLCDSIQPYHHYEGNTAEEFLTAVLEAHNANVSEDKRIYLGMCNISGDNTNSKTTAYRNTLEEIRVNLIERIGGELRVRKVDGRLVLDYMERIGVRSSTQIKLADNIKALSVDTDSTNIITRLVPLGYQLNPDETAERLTIAEVNEGCIYIDDENAVEKYGIIEGTVIFDDITLPENLKKAGQNYLINNNRIRKAYQAQVLDLSTIDGSYEPVRCGNTHPFLNEFMRLDEELRVMRRSVDIYKPYAPTIEIGDRAERITDIATRTARLIEYELPKQKLDILASAKATATDLINAGINGYVVVNGNEILIMDTPDKSTATTVWRWNAGGFGYSKSGYNGPYETAITMDGAIVADFITAGVLRGLEILNGDGTFHVSTDGAVTASQIEINNGSGRFHVSPDGAVTASQIEINNGSGKFHVSPDGAVVASAIDIRGGSIYIVSDSETYDKIQLICNEWSHAFSPLEFRLKNESTNCEIVAQAGGIWIKKDGENKIVLSSDGTVYCSDVRIGNSSDGFGSVRGELNAIWDVLLMG